MSYDRARLPRPPVPAAAPHAFPSPTSDNEQMNPIYTHQEHSPHLSPPHVPSPAQCELFDHVQRELSSRVDYAIRSNPAASHRRTVLHETSQLHQELNKFINSWKNQYLSSLGESTKRLPDDEDDEPFEDLHAPKKHQGPAGSDDEEEDSKGEGKWQCLFYEHDPDANIQCKTRRFKRASELRRHIKTHTLPFDCQICGYRTAEGRRLGSHKCEQANRKKYEPITPAERIQHDKLQKLGVKVGQMRQILFGDAGMGHSRDNSSGSERQSMGTSSTESLAAPDAPVSMPATSAPVYHPAPFTQQNFMFTSAPPNAPLVTMAPAFAGSPQPYLPSTYSPPPSTLPPNLPQSMPPTMLPYVTLAPPSYGGYPITHSPQTGHAGLYYRDDDDSPTSINSYSPGYQSYTTEPRAPPGREHSTASVNTFLARVFPEVYPTSSAQQPVLNRAMPQSEIEAMERNLALQARGISPLSRRATTFTLQQTVHSERRQLLVRLRNGNQSFSDRSRRFLRSVSMRRKKDAPVQSPVRPTSVLPTPPASDAGDAPEQKDAPPQRPEPSPLQHSAEQKRSFLRKLLDPARQSVQPDAPAERKSWKRMILGAPKPVSVAA